MATQCHECNSLLTLNQFTNHETCEIEINGTKINLHEDIYTKYDRATNIYTQVQRNCHSNYLKRNEAFQCRECLDYSTNNNSIKIAGNMYHKCCKPKYCCYVCDEDIRIGVSIPIKTSFNTRYCHEICMNKVGNLCGCNKAIRIKCDYCTNLTDFCFGTCVSYATDKYYCDYCN